MIKTKFKWFEFIPYTDTGPRLIDKIYDCVNKSGQTLGEVKYVVRWRQFTYFDSSNGNMYSSGCLKDISAFLDSLNNQHKEELERKK